MKSEQGKPAVSISHKIKKRKTNSDPFHNLWGKRLPSIFILEVYKRELAGRL